MEWEDSGQRAIELEAWKKFIMRAEVLQLSHAGSLPADIRGGLQIDEIKRRNPPQIGCTPKGAYSTRGRSRQLLEIAFSEPLLRTLLRTLLYCNTAGPLLRTLLRTLYQNPSQNPS